jgi:hypothetical protein
MENEDFTSKRIVVLHSAIYLIRVSCAGSPRPTTPLTFSSKVGTALKTAWKWSGWDWLSELPFQERRFKWLGWRVRREGRGPYCPSLVSKLWAGSKALSLSLPHLGGGLELTEASEGTVGRWGSVAALGEECLLWGCSPFARLSLLFGVLLVGSDKLFKKMSAMPQQK